MRLPNSRISLSFCPTSLLFSENSTPPHQKPGPSSAHDHSGGQISPFLPHDMSLSSCSGPTTQLQFTCRQIAAGLGPCSGLAHLHSVTEAVFPQPFWSSLPLHKARSCHLRAHKILSKFHGTQCPSAQWLPNTTCPPVPHNSLSISKFLFLLLPGASAHTPPLSVSHES